MHLFKKVYDWSLLSSGSIMITNVIRNTLTLIPILLYSAICISGTQINMSSEPDIPLHYAPQYGVYMATLQIGVDPVQTIEAIVDTGSSTMVVVADKKYCPRCAGSITKGAINPLNIPSWNNNTLIDLNYGSAKDTVAEYVAPIQYTQTNSEPLIMKIYVLKDTNQPTSIIGLIKNNLNSVLVKSTPFLVKITNNFNKYKHLTFVLCGEKGKSYFRLGSTNFQQKPLLQSRFLASQYYEINTSGFYDANHQAIAKTKNADGRAIIDTGTGGFIILTEQLYKPLYDYLYQHAGKQNQSLDSRFWKKSYCVYRKAIDFSALPTLQIGLTSMKDNQIHYLSIPPSTYINRAGCNPGSVRLVFNQDLPPNHPTAIRNHQIRVAEGKNPDMIIGTSLLNDYAIQFHYTQQPYIDFYDNTKLCMPDSH